MTERMKKMKMKKLLAMGVGTALVLSLGGAALASSGKVVAKTGSNESTAAVDTDNVQQGDQTGSDTTDTTDGTEEGSGGSSESDGPGGHADPAGNVDHQFDGNE